MTPTMNSDDENLWDDPVIKANDDSFDTPDAGRRFMGFFADVVATAIAYYALLFAAFYLFSQYSKVPTWLFDGVVSKTIPVVLYLVLVGGMEAVAGGQSIGKLVAGTVVVDEEGNRASAGQIALRTLFRLVPGEALLVWFDHQKRAGHDRVSKTKVVRKNPFNG